MCWRAVSKLFRTIGEIASKQDLALRRKVFIEGNPDVIGNRTYDGVDVAAVYWYASEMKRHFSGAEFDLARLDKVPQEFRLLDPDMIRGILDSQPKDYNEAQAENVLRLTGRIKALGRVVRKGAQTIATVPETRLLAQVA